MKIDWIDNKIAMSGAIGNYDELVKQGITMVINVRTEQHDDIWELTKRNISYFWIPVADWNAPRSDQIENFLELAKNRDDKILVHCAVGKGRSAFLVVSYLISKYKLSIEDAVKKAKKARPAIDMTPAQIKKLKIHFKE